MSMPTWIRVPGRLGSIGIERIVRVCGTWTMVKSRNGPLMRICARLIADELIISVVMISLVSYRALRMPGISVQTRPRDATEKNSTISVSVTGRWRSRSGARPATCRGEQELPLVAEVPDVRPERDDQAGAIGRAARPHQAVLPGRELDPAAPDVRVERERVVPEGSEQDPPATSASRNGHDRRATMSATPASGASREFSERVGDEAAGRSTSSVTRRRSYHQLADPLSAPGTFSKVPEPPLEEDGDPVAEIEELLEVSRDDDRAHARLGLLADLLPHSARRLHVEPVESACCRRPPWARRRARARGSTFWMLPPRERGDAGVTLGVRTSKRSISSLPFACTARCCIRPNRQKGRCPIRLRTKLRPTERGPTIPSPSRSSVTVAHPEPLPSGDAEVLDRDAA